MLNITKELWNKTKFMNYILQHLVSWKRSPSMTTCLSQFGLLWQNTTDLVAYKQQTFPSHSSRGWKSKIRLPALLIEGSFLGGENGNLAPWHPEPPAFAPSQSMICLAPRGCSPPLSLQSCHISFRDNLHVFVSNFNLILILYLHFPLTSPGSFMLHFGSRLGLQLLPI